MTPFVVRIQFFSHLSFIPRLLFLSSSFFSPQSIPCTSLLQSNNSVTLSELRTFSLHRGSSRQLCHGARWKFYMSSRLVGKAPGAREDERRLSVRLASWTAARRASIHFLQGHCYKAHFRNILKCSSQTSVLQQVSLRSGETSVGRDKQKTDFEVFLTYVSSVSLFVFFEVEREREGTTVWLLHEGLEKAGGAPETQCRRAERETCAWERGAQLAAHPAQPSLHGHRAQQAQSAPASVPLWVGERDRLTFPKYLSSAWQSCQDNWRDGGRVWKHCLPTA